MEEHAQYKRICAAIKAVAGDDQAAGFAAECRLYKTADGMQKFAWAQDVCSFLDSRNDDDKNREIRKMCLCSNGKKFAERIKGYLTGAMSISSFVDAYNAVETTSKLAYVTDHTIRIIYPKCYCSVVKYGQDQLSRTWCYCTLGHIQTVFSAVFEKPVAVDLLESVKTGYTRCVIAIQF